MLNFIFIFLKFTLSLSGGEKGGGRLVIPSCSLAAKIDEWWKNYTRNCDFVFQIFLHLTVKYFYNTCLHVFFFRKQVKKALSCNRYKMITIKSLLDPQSCGFVKALLYLKSCQKSSYKEILELYRRTFGDKENMNIDISKIRWELEPIKNHIQKLAKSDPTRKEEFLSF